MPTLDRFFLSSNKLEGDASYYKTGQGAPLVLLHGFAETHEIWNPLIENLSQKNELIIPAIPGCGNKIYFKNGLSMEAIAEFIFEILEQEQIKKTILFGHSMGGYAAMAFAEKYNDKLMGLSLVHSSAAADTEEKKNVRQKAIAHIKKNGSEGFFKGLIPKLYGSLSDFTLEKKKHFMMANQYDAAQAIACYEAMKKRPDRQHVLSSIGCPVQFIGGAEDVSVHFKDLEKQAALCSRASLTIFEGISHTSMHENAFLLKEAIIGFIDDILPTNEL